MRYQKLKSYLRREHYRETHGRRHHSYQRSELEHDLSGEQGSNVGRPQVEGQMEKVEEQMHQATRSINKKKNFDIPAVLTVKVRFFNLSSFRLSFMDSYLSFIIYYFLDHFLLYLFKFFLSFFLYYLLLASFVRAFFFFSFFSPLFLFFISFFFFLVMLLLSAGLSCLFLLLRSFFFISFIFKFLSF
jgi:ABC-type multidrug transport system permease subunit